MSGRTATKLAFVAAAMIVPLPWVLTSPPRNPDFVATHSIEFQTEITPEVTSLLRRACMDCHSNQTRWPWYSRLQPIFSQMHQDVTKARKAMNFSEWSTHTGRRPELAIGALAAVCGDVQSGRMPLRMYTLLHPEANLSEGDKTLLCNWTKSETLRYVRLKREGAAARRSQIVYNSATTTTAVPPYHQSNQVQFRQGVTQ